MRELQRPTAGSGLPATAGSPGRASLAAALLTAVLTLLAGVLGPSASGQAAGERTVALTGWQRTTSVWGTTGTADTPARLVPRAGPTAATAAAPRTGDRAGAATVAAGRPPGSAWSVRTLLDRGALVSGRAPSVACGRAPPSC